MSTDDSVAARFERICKRYPDRSLLHVLPETAHFYDIEAGKHRYQEIESRINAIAKSFSDAGYQRGERVVLLVENRPTFFYYFLALNQLGISVVPANPDLRLAELTYLVGHAQPCLAISVSSHAKMLGQAADAAGIDMAVVAPDSEPPPNHHPFAVARLASSVSEQEAALLYTSGTTGNPKGCVLSNSYFLECGNWYANTGGLCSISTDGERMITPLPLFHMNAMAVSFMAMLTVGGCLICLDRFHPRTWWQSVTQSKATCLHYLGVMPTILMGLDANENDTKHNIRFGFGAGIDSNLHDAFEKRFGFPLIEAWAMTETGCGAVIAANRLPRRVGESVIGKPENCLQIRIVDDNHNDVASNAPGELLVRHAGASPRQGFFSEYYKDAEATDAAWRDGWFHTGDIVRQESQGDMVFVDRKKNVIRRSGENIAAVEVEGVLMRHPQIDAAAVAAVPDKTRGDEVFACINTSSEATPQLAHDIVNWCLQQMAYYKAPAYVAFIDNIPLTSTQKIQRGELKQLAKSLLSDPQTVCTAALKKRQGI